LNGWVYTETKRNTELRELMGLKPAVRLVIKSSRLRWFGHVKMMLIRLTDVR